MWHHHIPQKPVTLFGAVSHKLYNLYSTWKVRKWSLMFWFKWGENPCLRGKLCVWPRIQPWPLLLPWHFLALLCYVICSTCQRLHIADGLNLVHLFCLTRGYDFLLWMRCKKICDTIRTPTRSYWMDLGWNRTEEWLNFTLIEGAQLETLEVFGFFITGANQLTLVNAVIIIYYHTITYELVS